MPKFVFARFAFCILLIFVLCNVARAQNKSCRFDAKTLSFAGTTLEQAKCLLRKVKIRAELEEQNLPALLENIVDQKVQISKEELREYLRSKNINENEIGGSLGKPVSKGRSNDKDAPAARYFVIHDTSTPNLCRVKTFPENINDADWKYNNPQSDLYVKSGEAHLYIMRDGRSVAPQGRTFETAWRATKLESSSTDLRGMFLHIENVQPRQCRSDLIDAGKCFTSRKNPKTGKIEQDCNDNIAPEIGFSDAQLDRLALVYIAASVRRGFWLIPAFHATVDAGLSDGHDDPQNFDLQKWSDKICAILTEMKVSCPG
jgi:hypothetical protein